jgi:hypothetical protein
VHSYSFAGSLLAYFIIPQHSSNSRVINLSVFRQYGKFAYLHAPRVLHERSILHKYIFKIGKSLFYLAGRIKAKQSRDKRYTTIHNIEDDAWPFKLLIDPRGTWWIPASFFQELIQVQVQELYVTIPKDWDNYLKFRYGNWKMPVKGWRYWIDDKAYQHKFPEELMEMIDV